MRLDLFTNIEYDENNDDEEEDEPPSIVRFVPEDTSTCKVESLFMSVMCYAAIVEVMFSALSQCQLLHPDPAEDSEEEEEERGML